MKNCWVFFQPCQSQKVTGATFTESGAWEGGNKKIGKISECFIQSTA